MWLVVVIVKVGRHCGWTLLLLDYDGLPWWLIIIVVGCCSYVGRVYNGHGRFAIVMFVIAMWGAL